MYDNQQRLINGNGGVPPLMHMGTGQQPPLYPFGLDHLEHVPKIDQHTSWDANHLNMMDDKHMVTFCHRAILKDNMSNKK